MNGKQGNGQPPCCNGSECCPPTSPGARTPSNRWKAVIFTAVILLAGAVAAFSLFRRSSEAPTSACCPPGSAAAAACGEAATVPGYDHTAAPTGLSLVILLHVGDVLSSEKMAIFGDVRAAVELQGAQLQVETLRFGDPAFMKLMDQHGITTFPAVVVMGQDHVLVLNSDQIRADTILSVFAQKSSSAFPDSASAGRSL